MTLKLKELLSRRNGIFGWSLVDTAARLWHWMWPVGGHAAGRPTLKLAGLSPCPRFLLQLAVSGTPFWFLPCQGALSTTASCKHFAAQHLQHLGRS